MMTRKFNQLLVSLGVTITLLANAYPQSARTVMVQSNTGALLFPTNLWSANASAARTGLGLGTAATNEASAFQASSAVLSNLASSNAVNLTNLRASNIVGVINASNIPAISLTNIGGTLPVEGGGTGATNAAGARTNLGLPLAALTNATESALRSAIGLPLAALTNTSEANFRTAIGLGTTNTASLNGVTAQTFTVTAGGGIVLQAALTNAGSFRTNIGLSAALLTNATASGFRTDLGLVLAALTNTSETSFCTAIGLGTTNTVAFQELVIGSGKINYGGGSPNGLRFFDGTNEAIKIIGGTTTGAFSGSFSGSLVCSAGVGVTFGTASAGIVFQDSNVASISRTNLGLGLPALTNTNNATFRAAVDMPWAGLTNTNASGMQTALFGVGTNPVLVNSNGTVVSPSNFLSSIAVAPAIQNFSGLLETSTNTITNSAAVYVFSLASNVSGVTNTLLLPTNSVSEGNEVTIVHNGPTSSTTTVRVAGAGTNQAALTGPGEAVRFLYRSSNWTFAPSLARVAPVSFVGSAASSNAAISRTNLGLPWSGLTNTDASGFRTDLGLSLLALTNDSSAGFRAGIGLPLAALTNTNAAGFQGAIFAATNAAPTNTTNVNAWIDIQVGTNSFKLPLYR